MSMSKEVIKNLDKGDIVRNDASGDSYIVVEKNGEYALAARTVMIAISEEKEWSLVCYGGSPGGWIDDGSTVRMTTDKDVGC